MTHTKYKCDNAQRKVFDNFEENANGMMTSSNGTIFRVTGSLRREFTGHRSIPRKKASDEEL